MFFFQTRKLPFRLQYVVTLSNQNNACLHASSVFSKQSTSVLGSFTLTINDLSDGYQATNKLKAFHTPSSPILGFDLVLFYPWMSPPLNHFLCPSFIFFRWSQMSTRKKLTNGNMISRDSTGKDDSLLLFGLHSEECSHTVQSYYVHSQLL